MAVTNLADKNLSNIEYKQSNELMDFKKGVDPEINDPISSKTHSFYLEILNHAPSVFLCLHVIYHMTCTVLVDYEILILWTSCNVKI